MDFGHWQAYDSWAMGPLEASRALPKDDPHKHEVVLRAGTGVPVLEVVASKGFRGIGDRWLEGLLTNLQVPVGEGGPKPTTVLGKVELLLRHLFPKAKDDAIMEMLSKRVPSSGAAHGMGEMYAHGSAGEGVMEPEDKNLAQAGEQQKEDRQETRVLNAYLTVRTGKPRVGGLQGQGSVTLDTSGKAASTASMSSTSAPPGSAQGSKLGPRKAKPPSVQEAKALMPQVKGIILQPYYDSCRFQVYYPTTGAWQRSKVYSWAARGRAGFTEADCLQACVDWVWAQHARETGEERAWDWS